MSTNSLQSQSGNWSLRFYRQLIRLYPREFTSAFGESVEQAFRDLARDAYRDRGRLGVLLLWFRVLPDFVFSAGELITAKAGDYLKWSFRLKWLLACSAGFAIGVWLSNFLIMRGFPPELAGLPLWLSLSFLQSLVLTGRYCRRTRWVLFSAVGAVLAAGFTRAVMPEARTVAEVLPMWAITLLNVPAVIHGAIIGLVQRKAFRKGHLNASRWILACAVGLYAVWLVIIEGSAPMKIAFQFAGDAIGFNDNFNSFTVAGVMTCLAAGAVFGVITAAPLERILRLQPSPVGAVYDRAHS